MNTVDKDEVSKFSHNNWWDYSSKESAMLHGLNILRMEFVERTFGVKSLYQNNILDIGCGGGIASESLTRVGGNVTAIDASAEAIQCAQHHAQSQNLSIKYIHTSIEGFSKDEKDEKFDFVFANDIIEHVACVKTFLRHAQNHIAQNGVIIISTINKNILSFILAKIAAEYIFNLVPKGTHSFEKFIKPQEIIQNLDECRHITTQGFSYNVINKKFFFEGSNAVNYFIVLQKK